MLEKIIERIIKPDEGITKVVQERLNSLTKPLGSLGRLEELAKKIAVIKGTLSPSVKNKVIFTMVGDHGVVEEGVSAYPKDVTAQMVYNFLNSGAGINVLARHVGARVVVVDMGVAHEFTPSCGLVIKKINFGTKNIAKGPAMSKEDAINSIKAGFEVVDSELKNGIDIIGAGDMGIGNTTPSSAIVCAITEADVNLATGRGTGIDDRIFQNKKEVIKRALEINKPNPHDGIDVLAKVGGYEIGGLVGVILRGASLKIPVVLDGFICGAAALVAYRIKPEVVKYLIASHCSVEPGHKIILDFLGLKPLLNLDLRLGEGTGAALGIGLIEASVKILTQMATFESAGVSRSNIRTQN
jgi:nicotinate-nucleotide--dimethylbenzimidazole phosphoribosyltransferase